MLRQSGARNAPAFLVLIDQEPLRRGAANDCTNAMARLESARAGWHRFEREDKPAFARWRAREFGALLSRAREVEDKFRDSQALVHEVEMEMRRTFQDAHSAYQRVMFRRANRSAADTEEVQTEPRAAGQTRPVSEFEQEALFQEWVHKSLGTNPDKMDDDAYSTSFEAFKSHMFRSPAAEPAPRNNYQQKAAERTAVPEPEDVDDGPVDTRVKELYRTLVRRLHPDLRADGVASVSALWHEVQEAYAASDVARMEILLALSQIESDHMSEETTLSQMRSLFADLVRSLRALEKSLQEAEGEDAWNFARSGAGDDLRLRVQRQLKSDLASRTARLEMLQRTITAWAEGPVANRKAALRRPPQFASRRGFTPAE